MAEKDAGYSKDEKLTGGQSFKLFLWNPNTKEVLGRTGSSWIKILIFYIIFYACLAAFWALLLLIFYQTIDLQAPKWELKESRIGDNPGLGFRPRPTDDKVESTLIWFTSGENGNWQHWKDNLDEYLQPYESDAKQEGKGEKLATVDDCKSNKQPNKGDFCPFTYKDVTGHCNKNNDFGYKQGAPCVLIKLNRIYNWEPVPYTKPFAPYLPAFNESNGIEGVFITCEGENPADKENIGPVEYSPSQLIRKNHFPYTNQPGYMSPFVMVHFKQPSRGVLINVECRAWAENIKYEKQDREGSVHFELLID